MRQPALILRTILMMLMFLSARGTLAGPVIQEDFEGPLLPGHNSVEGRSGQGWVQPATGENLVWPVSLTEAQVGMISLTLSGCRGPVRSVWTRYSNC